MVESSQKKVLFICGPSVTENMFPLRDNLLTKLGDKIQMQTVTTFEEYEQVSESDRYTFEVICTCMAPPLTQQILNDQVPKNTNLKFV
jgi:hypothetical protein